MPESPRTSNRPSASHTSTNQGEAPGISIPKKRTRTLVEHSEDTPRTHRSSYGSVMPGFEEVMDDVPSPGEPSLANMPFDLSMQNQLAETQTFIPRFVSPRRLTITPRRLIDKLDCIASSQPDTSHETAKPAAVEDASTTPIAPRSPNGGRMNPAIGVSDKFCPPLHVNDSPICKQASPQVALPAQPIRDSSPLSDYDVDPAIHPPSQTHTQPLFQPLEVPRNSREPTSGPNQSYYTARMHPSPIRSSQSPIPSRSPIKGGVIYPNQSASGVHGVVGLLGFGSKTSDNEDFQIGLHGPTEEPESLAAHIPVLFSLPPSSPPRSPARETPREASPDMRGVQPKQNVVASSPRVYDSPLQRDSPSRATSPLTEDTRTEEETETPWESLRPSQSVSQVFERRVIEVALKEANERLQAYGDKVQNAKGREEQLSDWAEDDDETDQSSQEELQQEYQDQTLARPITISSNPQPPNSVPVNPRLHQPRAALNSKTSIASQEGDSVASANDMGQPPVKVHQDPIVIVLSSPTGAEEGLDEDGTYVEEECIPTESQQSFSQHTSSEVG